MNLHLVLTANFKDGEYYQTELFAVGNKFYLLEERRGYGVGAMIVSEDEREISRAHAMDIIRSIKDYTRVSMNVSKGGYLTIFAENWQD